MSNQSNCGQTLNKYDASTANFENASATSEAVFALISSQLITRLTSSWIMWSKNTAKTVIHTRGGRTSLKSSFKIRSSSASLRNPRLMSERYHLMYQLPCITTNVDLRFTRIVSKVNLYLHQLLFFHQVQ